MIDKIFNGAYLKRLDNIIQWSEMDVITRESVSQHSYKVTIFCRVLLEEIFGHKFSPVVANYVISCVDHAMFHDWDEALLLRDISHETKYNEFNGDKIRAELDALSEFLAKKEFETDTVGGQLVYDALNTTDSKVLLFCKVCDWMALAFFIKREQSRGNTNLSAQYATVRNGLTKSIDNCKAMLLIEFSNYKPNVSVFDEVIESIYGKD